MSMSFSRISARHNEAMTLIMGRSMVLVLVTGFVIVLLRWGYDPGTCMGLVSAVAVVVLRLVPRPSAAGRLLPGTHA
jgi:hypothetical protein